MGKTIRSLSHAKARHHQRAKFVWKYGVYSRFYTAIRKYGFESFEWKVVYRGVDDADIQAKERMLISQYRSIEKEFGYNMTPGGDGGAGKKLSNAHIEKLRQYFSGENNPQFGKHGSEHPAFGHRHSIETKQKISAAHKGRLVSDETRIKLSETRKALFAERVALRRLKMEAERIRKREVWKKKVESGELKGEKSRASKLTDQQRREICHRRQSGESYGSIAENFSVGLTGVRSVCQTWGPLNGFPFLKLISPRKQRLSEGDKREICSCYKQGVSMALLAKKYKVGETTIHTVLRSWGPINGFPELETKRSKKKSFLFEA